jgi:hypothetical protein
MGLLLAEGKMLKHLKEKPQHKSPYHYLNFLWRRTPQQRLRTQRNIKAYNRMMKIIIIIIIIIIIVIFLVIEHRRNEIDWGRPKYSGKPCPSATLSTTNPTWTHPESNTGLRLRRRATNCLNNGTTLNHKLHQREHCLRMFLCYFMSL